MAFARGARPSPRHKLLAAIPHLVAVPPPPQVAYVPKQLSFWGNQSDGDCCTAEEAFAKACYSPEIFIPEATVIAWASAHGVLNGANISDILDWFQNDGFKIGGQQYNDGPHTGVDYATEMVLQSAISQGPVKIGIDANALPGTAGKEQGWFAIGGGRFPNTDHCVSLSGYGPAGWLYQQLGVSLPSSISPNQPGYLLFTWNSIGFVDHAWIMGTTTEAWVRNPTTIGSPPLPGPPPAPVPIPPTPVPPTPTPTPSITLPGVLAVDHARLAKTVKANPFYATALTKYQGWVDGDLAAQFAAAGSAPPHEAPELLDFDDPLVGG